MPAKKKVAKKRKSRANPVTPKRLLFCFEYLIDQDGSKAIVRAGYKCKTPASAASMAHEILQVPEIKQIIQAGLKAKIERCEINADWVLKQSVRVYERCMQDESVFDKYGNNTGEYKFEHAGANKALDSIGKHVKVQAFKESVEVNASEDLLKFLNSIPSTTGPPSER